MDKEMLSFYKNALMGTSMIEPLCEEYRGLWKACHEDNEKFVALSLRQQAIPYVATQCYLGKGLAREYVEKNFADYINGRRTYNDCDDVKGYTYQLYCGFIGDCVLTSDVSHFMWSDNATINIPTSKCPTIYVSNRSHVTIACDGYNSFRIYMFDESCVTMEDLPETSNVVVYKYDTRCDVVLGKYALGDIKEHQKTLRL